MHHRRDFLKLGAGFLAFMGCLFDPLFSTIRRVCAEVQKTILPSDTKRESLIYKDPKSLDARNLQTTPLKDFGTMGTTDFEVNLNEWRLEVAGGVAKPLRLTYEEIRSLPSIEKYVLLICPGFFANYGKWKGVSMKDLLEKAGVEKGMTHITFTGPNGTGGKVEKFPIEEVLQNKVFLAYEVNGQTLPQKHGYPLRVVAEGYYGDDWVKYVYKMAMGKG